MLTGDTGAAAETRGDGAQVPTGEPAATAKNKGGGKKKKKKENWREAAARRFEEAKQSASVAVANVKNEYERSKLAGRVAKEDKFAMAWRNTCMAELDEETVARDRVVNFAADGAIEVDNPMALRALSTVDMSCSNLSVRLAEQDSLVESMAASSKKLAAHQMKVLRSAEANILSMMPTVDAADDGGAAAEVTRIIDACEQASYTGWAQNMLTAVNAKSAAFKVLHKDEIQTLRKDFIITTQASRDAMKSMLADKTDEGFAEKHIIYEQRRRHAEATRAQLTKALVGARSKAYTTPIDQLDAFLQTQREFFQQGLQALEGLQPEVEKLRARAQVRRCISPGGQTSRVWC